MGSTLSQRFGVEPNLGFGGTGIDQTSMILSVVCSSKKVVSALRVGTMWSASTWPVWRNNDD